MQVRFASTPQRLNASRKALHYFSMVPAQYYYVMCPRRFRAVSALILAVRTGLMQLRSVLGKPSLTT